MKAPRAMPPRDRRNAVCFCAGEALWGFAASLMASATVLSMCLRHFGADERMIGAIGTVDTAAVLFPQIFGMYLFSSKRNRKRRLILWHLICMIPFVWLAAVAILHCERLSPRAVRWVVLGCWAGFMSNIGLVLAAWSDWVAHLFETRIRGTVFGLAMFASALSGTGGGLLAGTLLAKLEQPRVFAWLYLAGGACACLSIVTFWRVDDPADRDPEDPRRPRFGEMLARFRESLADVNFRNFLVARILSSAGFCIVPLIAYHFSSAEGGGLSGDRIVRLGAATTAGSALSNLLLGRLGDRHGHRLGLLAGSVAQIGTLTVLLALTGPSACLTAYFLAGIVIGSSLVSHQNMMFETCPHDQRIAHLTVGSLVLGVFTSLLPLAAGAAAKRWDLRTVFSAALCVSIAALIWLLLRVKEPRVLLARNAQYR